jgi:hypothetical protein
VLVEKINAPQAEMSTAGVIMAVNTASAFSIGVSYKLGVASSKFKVGAHTGH